MGNRGNLQTSAWTAFWVIITVVQALPIYAHATQVGAGAAPVATRSRGQQASSYSAANEKLSLVALYMQTKISEIEKAWQTASDHDKIKNEEFSEFCLSGDSTDDCYKRWQAGQALTLAKVRMAMLQNGDGEAALLSSTPVKGGEVSVAAIMEDPNVQNALKPSPRVPDLPKFDDFVKQYEDQNGEIRKMVQEGYKNWAKGMQETLTKPVAEQDFGKATTRLREATNPGAGEVVMTSLEPGADPKLLKAKQTLEQTRAQRGFKVGDKKSQEFLLSALPNTYGGKLNAPSAAKIGAGAKPSFKVSRFEQESPTGISDRSKEAYRQARNLMVKEVNRVRGVGGAALGALAKPRTPPSQRQQSGQQGVSVAATAGGAGTLGANSAGRTPTASSWNAATTNQPMTFKTQNTQRQAIVNSPKPPALNASASVDEAIAPSNSQEDIFITYDHNEMLKSVDELIDRTR